MRMFDLQHNENCVCANLFICLFYLFAQYKKHSPLKKNICAGEEDPSLIRPPPLLESTACGNKIEQNKQTNQNNTNLCKQITQILKIIFKQMTKA